MEKNQKARLQQWTSMPVYTKTTPIENYQINTSFSFFKHNLTSKPATSMIKLLP